MSIRVGLKWMGRSLVAYRVTPSANSYFNDEGSIWFLEIGWYMERPGQCAVYVDEPQGWGGWYFNRL